VFAIDFPGYEAFVLVLEWNAVSVTDDMIQLTVGVADGCKAQ
jgi:hypothetical protein